MARNDWRWRALAAASTFAYRQRFDPQMNLETRQLHDNFATEVMDVDLASVTDDLFGEIRALWQSDPVVLFRRQSLTESELIAFSRRFGELDLEVIRDINTSDDVLDDRVPELFFVSNLYFADGRKVGGLSNDEVVWHTDQIFRKRPASGSIFYGIEMPQDTGRTSFCNMARAYDTLGPELRRQVDGRRSVCKYGTERPLAGYMRANVEKNFRRETTSKAEVEEIDRRTPQATHELVLENQATGQRSLYLSPNHTAAIEGLSDQAGSALFDALFEHAVQPENIYTHEWRNGDVLMWDNARLLHRREAFDSRIPRLAKRTTVYMDPAYFAVPRAVVD